MITPIISRLVILVFGNLYPAYASYKAVRTKNVKEYVKWMMYWIVFALFTCAETFTDVFFSFWFPFYYGLKTIIVFWLLSPATEGSSILYRRFVHPALIRREAEIDEALARATEQGYTAVLHLGTKGVNYATTVLMQTAIKQMASLAPSSSEGQSETAICSSASSRDRASTVDTRTTIRDDEHDGAARTEPVSRRRDTNNHEHDDDDEEQEQQEQRLLQLQLQQPGTSSSLDLHEVTTEEESEAEKGRRTFKVPARKPAKARKPRKDRGVPRKVRSRPSQDSPTHLLELSDDAGASLD